MSMTPFEVRLEVLKLAKDLVMEEYYAKRQKIDTEFETLRNFNIDKNISKPISYPELPKVPSEVDIITKATILNNFVSDTSKK